MALTQSRLPVVMSLWGTDLYGPFGWVSKACAPFCDAVVVMSEEMAAEFDRDCDVIPHGVDLNRFQPAPREQARQAVGWNEDDYYVLFPYRPGREVKNYPLAERVVAAVDDILSQNVRIETISGAPQDRFIQYLNAADCMLLTSNREGSPNVVKEALACNLPVVSVDVGDVSERLDGVEPSVVCDSEAALVGAVHDVLRQQERSNGREHVQTLSLERMGHQLRSVYERVLDEQSVPKVSSQETK
jgi:glycosyltransferase involved in cell wall biosynthesis